MPTIGLIELTKCPGVGRLYDISDEEVFPCLLEAIRWAYDNSGRHCHLDHALERWCEKETEQLLRCKDYISEALNHIEPPADCSCGSTTAGGCTCFTLEDIPYETEQSLYEYLSEIASENIRETLLESDIGDVDDVQKMDDLDDQISSLTGIDASYEWAIDTGRFKGDAYPIMGVTRKGGAVYAPYLKMVRKGGVISFHEFLPVKDDMEGKFVDMENMDLISDDRICILTPYGEISDNVYPHPGTRSSMPMPTLAMESDGALVLIDEADQTVARLPDWHRGFRGRNNRRTDFLVMVLESFAQATAGIRPANVMVRELISVFDPALKLFDREARRRMFNAASFLSPDPHAAAYELVRAAPNKWVDLESRISGMVMSSFLASAYACMKDVRSFSRLVMQLLDYAARKMPDAGFISMWHGIAEAPMMRDKEVLEELLRTAASRIPMLDGGVREPDPYAASVVFDHAVRHIAPISPSGSRCRRLRPCVLALMPHLLSTVRILHMDTVHMDTVDALRPFFESLTEDEAMRLLQTLKSMYGKIEEIDGARARLVGVAAIILAYIICRMMDLPMAFNSEAGKEVARIARQALQYILNVYIGAPPFGPYNPSEWNKIGVRGAAMFIMHAAVVLYLLNDELSDPEEIAYLVFLKDSLQHAMSRHSLYALEDGASYLAEMGLEVRHDRLIAACNKTELSRLLWAFARGLSTRVEFFGRIPLNRHAPEAIKSLDDDVLLMLLHRLRAAAAKDADGSRTLAEMVAKELIARNEGLGDLVRSDEKAA